MKILCGLSSIEYDVQHFPGYLTSRESYHPVFDIPQRTLLTRGFHKWSAGELTETDSYLLYLALFNSTDLVKWHTPARRNLLTRSVVAANMESLVRAIDKINLVSHPSFVVHHIAITSDTADFSASPIWIDNWHNNYAAFVSGYKDEVKHDKLARKERHMDKLLDRLETGDIEKLARIIADWTEMVAEFPAFAVLINNQRTTLAEYWKGIIIKCAKQEGVFTIPESDLMELYSHCEECSSLHGSTYGRTLMTILRSGLKRLDDPFDLNTIDFDIKHPGFVILSKKQANSTEEANIAAMIAAAPEKLPLESDIGTLYPSKIAYLRAKARWDAAELDKENKKAIAEMVGYKEIPDILDEAEQLIGDDDDSDINEGEAGSIVDDSEQSQTEE